MRKIQTIDAEKNGINVHQATKTGYIFCPVGGIFDASYPKSNLRRGRVQGNGYICPTITTSPDNLLIVDSIYDEVMTDSKGKKKIIKRVRVRKLTEKECFRLMGMKDSDIDKLLESGLSRSSLYKLAGNSVVVDIWFHIFRTLFIDKKTEKGKSNKLF